MSRNLFADDSDSNESNELKFNKDYAKSYNKFRQKEFVQKLKEQDARSNSSSSESETTDDEDEVVNPKFDELFFKTLSSLKSKDPKIYDKKTTFFEELTNEFDTNDQSLKEKFKKPLTLKDYERKIILEKGGKYEDDEDSDENETEERPLSPSFADEQRKLKEEFKSALNSDDSDEEFGVIFKKRQKTNEEREKEEDEYTKWLAGQKDDIEESDKKSLIPLKEYWNNPKLSNPEKFLRDYVLNKGYVDKEEYEIPTYEEIVGDANLSDDEKELEKQAEFEHKYNFRFEEPDQDFIKRYPRTIDNSVRKTDDSRKKKRQETKERKLKEKEEKMKEFEMLKELKRQEIEEKIQKLKDVTGNEELAFKEDELEDEFDPDAHDKKMQEIFNDDYYMIDEGDEKPNCPDIDELKYEDWDNFDPKKEVDYEEPDYEQHCEDENFNMDCDYDPNTKESFQNELIENMKDKRKRRKRKNQFMDMIKKEKPTFNPEDEKSYAEYIDEYYKMDCEDVIGDIPCRFKYTECEPNDFGLTIEEILLAKNKELNQWASLKKAVQIRPSYVEKKEKRLYQLKAKNEDLKRKIFVSLYGAQSDNELEETEENSTNEVNVEKKATKRKREITSTENKVDTNAEMLNKQTSQETAENVKVNKKKKKKKKKSKNISNNTSVSEDPKVENEKKTQIISPKASSSEEKRKMEQFKFNVKNKSVNTKKNKFREPEKSLSDERLRAYGINPKKFHKNQKFVKSKMNSLDKNNSKKKTFSKNKKNPFS